jgi:hypothetical protein
MRARVPALIVVVCLAAAAVTSCGASLAPSTGGAPTPIVTTGSVTPPGAALQDSARPRPQTLTVADDGRQVRLHVGQMVVVVLASGGPMWDVPKSSGMVLRRTTASGGYPTTRPARAAFLAVRGGTSAITSISDARCLHSVPRCAIPQRLWNFVIVVR